MKIKTFIFDHVNATVIDKEVNAWIKSTKGKGVVIREFKTSTSTAKSYNKYYYITILYTTNNDFDDDDE